MGELKDGLSVREATRGDVPAVLVLYHQLTLHPNSYRDPDPAAIEVALADFDRSPHTRLLVAETQGRIVATLVLVIVPNLSYGARPWAIIENMVVNDGERRGGIGRELLGRAVAIARDRGCYKVELQSRRQRDWAHRFYESCGFRPIATGYKLYFDGEEPSAG